MTYQEFLESKIDIAPESGFDISIEELNPNLSDHQKVITQWAIKGGRRAVFAQFGLGKTCIQLEFIHQIIKRKGGKGLICMPLGVKQEFEHDAVEILGYEKPEYVRSMDEAKAAKGSVLLTNYERLRDNPWDLKWFTATSLDEASILRSFGSKTYQEFLPKFKGVKYKMVATAVPSPNRIKEGIHYAGYLEIADTGNALTRYFKRDSTKANNLTLYPSMADQYWLWFSTWSVVVSKPSDLNPAFPDKGYELPPLTVNWHELPIEYGKAMEEDGQMKLFEDAALGLKQAAHVKRDSTEDRLNKVMELLDEYIQHNDDQAVVWVTLNNEQVTLERMMRKAGITYSSLTGSQDIDTREELMRQWKAKETQVLLTKPEMYAQGVNLQQCNRMIFSGISYKFEEFIQGVHRIQRFGQERHVYVDAIFMESEREIKTALMKKWEQHEEMVQRMTDIVKQYGLNTTDKVEKLKRKMGCKVKEVEGEHYKAVNADCIEYTKSMDAESVDMILTSIPFGNHYEYCNNVNDLGYNDNLDRFFEQMDYLTPELLRVLKPGRVCVIHVKDRVLFGNVTGYSFPTMDAFHMYTTLHFMKHGFKYFGMITVTTDVVRENNQTYRLGYTKMRKDSTNMGVGCEEYLLLFRKLPTDTSDGFADVRVTHEAEEYPLSEWQLNASAFWRDSGDRLLTPEELAALPMSSRMKLWKEFSQSHLYSYEFHKKFSEDLENLGGISKEFMTLPPASVSDNVWDDIVRMRTLNLNQSNKRRELHVCLAEGSLVLTREGYKPIEKVQVGDMVLTHLGNWKHVIAKECEGSRDTIVVNAQGVANLTLTPDHKLWIRSAYGKTRPKEQIVKDEPHWKESKDTLGDYVNLKLPDIEDSDLTVREWWIVGRYLADGHKGTRGDFYVSVGKGKEEEFEQNAGDFAGSFRELSCRQYRLKNISRRLDAILRKCGRGAENKQVPIEGLCLNKELSEALLSGYLSGDGNTTGTATSATSVSKALCYGIAMVVQRARNVIASVRAGKPAGTTVIEGRTVNTKQEWIVCWREGHHSFGEILLDGAWKRVRSVEEFDAREVWNIQVADDASFTVEGCIVKNCPLQLDLVERCIKQYSNEGEVVYDPFAGIFTVPYTAVRMGRYGLGTELNGSYWSDGISYCQDAENEIKSPTLFDFLNLESED